MALLASTIITAARLEHPLFANVDRHPNNVCLSRLSTQQQIMLGDLAEHLTDRISQGLQIAAVIANELVGVDSSGAAFTVSTTGDGYSVLTDSTTGTLYLSSELISTDPYTDGFPLPSDALKLVDIYATDASDVRYPVEWRAQRDLSKMTGWQGLLAIVNGYRLMPIIPPQGTSISTWANMVSVTLSYIAQPAQLTALSDALTVPSSYEQTLIYDLAAFLSRRELSMQQQGDPPFPPGLVEFYAEQASANKASDLEDAFLEHKPLKRLTMKRNR